jgi:cobalt-zinc-cadmium resistance protein CzcA
MFGELIIMIVYLPILFLEGMEGKLFRPMALTVIFALVGSMVLSLTLMPVLASLFLPRHPRRRDLVMRALLSGLPTGAGALAAPALGRAGRRRGRPRRRGAARCRGWAPSSSRGSAKARSSSTRSACGRQRRRVDPLRTQIELLLLAEFPDEIEHIWTRTGTPEVATDPMGLELSDVFITLKPRERWTKATSAGRARREMQLAVSDLPGMRAAFMQPIEMRVNEMVAGIRSDVGVKLFGDDFELLKLKGRDIEALLKKMPGRADVTVEQVTGQPVLQIVVDRDAIARHGIAARDVLEVVRALGTLEVGAMQEAERRFPIAVRIHDRYRLDPEHRGKVLVTAPNGDRVPLAKLATLQIVDGPATIQREWAKRRIVVQANVRGRDVGGFVDEARRQIDDTSRCRRGTTCASVASSSTSSGRRSGCWSSCRSRSG